MTVQPAPLRRLVRAVVTALVSAVAVVGAAGFGAAPLAAGPANDVSVTASGNVALTVGGRAGRVNFEVRNNGATANNLRVTITVPLGDQGLEIEHGPDGCRVNGTTLRCQIERLDGGQSVPLFVSIRPPADGGPAPGDSRSGTGQIRVDTNDINNRNNAASFGVTLSGPEQPKGVRSVSGTITDVETGKPVENARVTVTDGGGTNHKTATNANGQYKVAPGGEHALKAGTIKITVAKEGYKKKEFSRSTKDGDTVKLDLTLEPKAKPSASEETTPTKAGGGAGRTDGAEEGGSDWIVWLLYLLAGLLVLGGIGAIVWLFVRRNEDEEYDEDPDRPGYPGPRPGARGIYHGDPYGAPTTAMGANQPTTMLGQDAPTSRLGHDAPTSMINRPSYDQPTSMIDRSQLGRGAPDQPTQLHPGQPAADDVYPQGREHYATGTSQGYGVPRPDPDAEYGDRGTGRGYGGPDPGYGGGRHGADPRPGYGGQDHQGQGYGRDPGYGGGYGNEPGRGGGRHSAGGEYDRDQNPPRSSGGRHSTQDDRRLDWYED